ncbi:hypothetical protein O6H91_Y304200 [Diphasiastrum complanatum]|nr:hypothetical protein O6H91_Y304200 [Diphasiastrum complanatum]
MQILKKTSCYYIQVKKIPSTFSSVEQYVESFRWPLLGETRAQLQQGLEAPNFSRLPHATVTLEKKGNHSNLFKKFVMHLKIAEWKDNSSLMVLDARPSHVVLLTSPMPQTVHSLMSNEEQSILAVIQGSAIGSNGGSSFRVKIYAATSSNRHKILQNSSKNGMLLKSRISPQD